jgi:dihydroorotate dehydrogenase electron transfer subunit
MRLFNMDRGSCIVVSNEAIAENVFRMILTGELVKGMTTPGQFVHVKCGDGIDPLLRRPISICDVNLENQECTLIYRAEGKGTKLLSQKVMGEKVDLLGPLGKGFPVQERKKGEKALLIGGGVGVPPLYYLAKELVRRGVKVYSVLGFGQASQVFLADEFLKLGENHVTTIDGSYGRKGLVTDVLDEGFASDWDVLYSCGPLPMLKALQDRYQGVGREAYISIEQRMGCGVGACLACVVKPCPTSPKSYYKICSDGPVFPIGEVVL